MFDFLQEVNRRPELFAEYTAQDLWTDSHTSEQMLAYHLNESVDAASRNNAFIERSVKWIVSHFELSAGAKVADFGCGPGLYAQRLARTGLDVTGIDFSANSLCYARKKAAEENLDIEYIEANYLGFDTDCRFDLIIMIMCDFCALSPDQRMVLLNKFNTILADDGMILLDVYSRHMFDEREESATYGLNLLNGFWAPGEYYGFLNTFKYNDEKVLLDKYTVVERNRTRQVFNWLQCFTPAEIESEFNGCEFQVVELLGDVAGEKYNPNAREFAIIARKVNSK